jgi:hypothetical protein
MAEPVLERLTQLEDAVRRATEMIVRLRDENRRLREEREQVLTQVDSILRDLTKLDAGS